MGTRRETDMETPCQGQTLAPDPTRRQQRRPPSPRRQTPTHHRTQPRLLAGRVRHADQGFLVTKKGSCDSADVLTRDRVNGSKVIDQSVAIG